MKTKPIKWTEDKIKLIKVYIEEGLTIMQIAEKMKLSYKQVEHAIHKNGLRSQSVYTQPKEEKALKPKEVDKLIIQTLKTELQTTIPYKASPETKVDKKGDTLVIQLTDLHAGKMVKDQEGTVIYDEKIFRIRIDRLCEQILKLLDHNITKGVPIHDVVILSTGDLANGEGIYATQAYEQELAPPRQVMLVVDVIKKLIVSLLARKLSVRFYGIRGNHGRTGKDTDIASNWDLMIYLILDFWAKEVLKSPLLQVRYAETEQMTFDIRGHQYLVRHIAPEQADSPAGRVKINEWARKHNASAIVFGHYHHFGLSDVDGIRVFRGGSTVGGDSLSESMAKHSEPIQLVWGVNEHRVSTFFYAVDLGEKQ
jgi:predicted phosphodiesterase